LNVGKDNPQLHRLSFTLTILEFLQSEQWVALDSPGRLNTGTARPQKHFLLITSTIVSDRHEAQHMAFF
jgi:hypothetical protein